MLDDGRQNETRAEKRGKNGGKDAVKRKFRIVAGEKDKGRNPKRLTAKGDKYKFKVKKNGKYTILIQDTKGNFYSKVVKVKGLKKSK